VVQPDGTLFDPNGDKHHFTVKGETLDVPTVGNEQFDRLFIAVSAPRLFHSDVFNIVPKVYYYQTVYNDGEDHFGQIGSRCHFFSSLGVCGHRSISQNEPRTSRSAESERKAVRGHQSHSS
jgi:hypothetical protein